MKLPIYQLDAFTDTLFAGNPAAVVPLESWLDDELMQKIAEENNLAETAFYVPIEAGFHIRWFTPVMEVNLCGHATLATAYVIFQIQGYEPSKILFDSKSGLLKVTKKDNWLTLDFPTDTFQIAVAPPALAESMRSLDNFEIFKGKDDYMMVVENEALVRDLEPDIFVLSTVPTRGIIVTAPGDEVDFVSRFFAPQSGVDEDPVTGSAHTLLTPYWAEQLNKTTMTAKQLSARGGYLRCELAGDRTLISGQVRHYMTGEILVE